MNKLEIIKFFKKSYFSPNLEIRKKVWKMRIFFIYSFKSGHYKKVQHYQIEYKTKLIYKFFLEATVNF